MNYDDGGVEQVDLKQLRGFIGGAATLSDEVPLSAPRKKIMWASVLVAVGVIIAAIVAISALTNRNTSSPTIANEIAVGARQDVGDYIVEITSYRLTQNRVWTTDLDLIVVTYEWTNNSGSPRAFENVLRHYAFQNGIACNVHTWAVDGVQTADANNPRREVQSGMSQTVRKTYELHDTTSPVSIEIGTRDDRLTHTINIASFRQSHSTPDRNGVAGSGNNVSQGDVLYNGKPIINWLGSGLVYLRDEFGVPDIDGIVGEGEAYGYMYGNWDVVFVNAYDGDYIGFIYGQPAAIMLNGVTLDTNRDQLIRLFGTPVYEGWGDEDYYAAHGMDNAYFMQFIYQGISISFELDDPNGKAYSFSVY
jgi:hypothetical protein